MSCCSTERACTGEHPHHCLLTKKGFCYCLNQLCFISERAHYKPTASHWKASFLSPMAQIGCCNLAVSRKRSARGLLSQVSYRNILTEYSPWTAKKKKKVILLSINKEFGSNWVKSQKAAFCRSELQETFHNGRTTLISGHVYNTTKTRLLPVMA